MNSRVWDVLALAGGILLTGGLVAIYWPLGLIGAGAVLTGLGVYGARVYARSRADRRPHPESAESENRS